MSGSDVDSRVRQSTRRGLSVFVTAIHNRMPVILHPDDEAAWLSPANDNDRDVLEALLRPYEDGGLEMFPVSRDVNIAWTNEKYLVAPLNSV